MKQMETKGYGYFRKTKAYGLVCGITLAGALMLGSTAFADDTITLNPATNLTTLQTPPTADQTQLARQAGHQSGELVSDVTSAELEQAVTAAQEAGVDVKQSDKVTHDSLSAAQTDLEKQTETVREATAKQETNTTAINQALAENKAIDQANRDEKARVDAINAKGEADIKAKNAAGQAQVEAQNKQAQEAADAENARLKADYEAKLTEIEHIKAENEAIRKRNQQASQATHQANQAAQAAYQEKLAEIERIKAENAAIRQRNAKAQQEAERQNQELQAAYEAKLAEIKQIEAENAAIRQRNEQAGQATNQTNQEAQAAYQQKLAEIERIKAENAAIRDRNQKAQQEAERQNQALQAAYEAKLAEIKQIEAENAAIRKRNEQAGQATHQANQETQAAYQEKLAEIERIKAENAVIRQRNEQAQAAVDQKNQQLRTAYEAQLSAYQKAVQAKKEAENKAIDQVVFGIDAKDNGVDNAEYGNSIMTVTTQPDGSFVFKHDMIDGKKTIGHGTLTGKINHHYEANKDGSITAYIDSVTFDTQVLAPFVIRDKTMLVNKDVNQDNLKTFNIYGKRILVGFVPVERAEFANALRVFNMDTNEYLSRHSKGKHDDLSLDEMFEKMDNDEKFGYDPTGIPSHEEKLMLIETLEELIDVVYQRNEKYGKILKLIYQDVTISKQEIIEKLGLKKTQGYDAIKKAHALAKEVYNELNQ